MTISSEGDRNRITDAELESNKSLNNLDNRDDNLSQLNSQLMQLNRQLISYQVIDRQGIPRGVVSDIYYAADNSINLLIELEQSEDRLSLHRLEQQDIHQLDFTHKLVLSSLSYQQLENLPLDRVSNHSPEAMVESDNYNDREMNPTHTQDSVPASEIQKFRLFEEKLKVERRKQKVGEVIVRKQVETRIVQMHLRRETLIVERTGIKPERLSEVVISENKVNGFKYGELDDRAQLHTTRSNYLELETAQQLLEAIANLSSVGKLKVRLEIVTDSSEQQLKHQQECDRYI